MAVDATGTPTSPDSIPTYTTGTDAPSGRGFNAAIAAIQTALSARWLKSLFTTTGDVAYASAASTPARLGIGSTGNVLTVAGGLPTWAAPATTELAFIESTTTSSTSVTAPVTGGLLLWTLPAIVCDGTSRYRIETFFPGIANSNSGAATDIWLLEDGNERGLIGRVGAGFANADTSVFGVREYIPTAGSHVWTMRGLVSAGTGSFHGGTGAASQYAPAHVRVLKVT